MRKWDEDEKRVFDMIKVLRGLDTEHVWAVPVSYTHLTLPTIYSV